MSDARWGRVRSFLDGTSARALADLRAEHEALLAVERAAREYIVLGRSASLERETAAWRALDAALRDIDATRKRGGG